MAKVRSKGNKSTEAVVEAVLKEERIDGWQKHVKFGRGGPDFYFPEHRLAVFVDGCFWHSCPICKRRTPSARAEYWGPKIDENRRRDDRLRRKMRDEGHHVMRVWEHELKRITWLKRLKTMLNKTAPHLTPADRWPRRRREQIPSETRVQAKERQ